MHIEYIICVHARLCLGGVTVLITPRNFIFNPFGVIYPCSLTPVLVGIYHRTSYIQFFRGLLHFTLFQIILVVMVKFDGILASTSCPYLVLLS